MVRKRRSKPKGFTTFRPLRGDYYEPRYENGVELKPYKLGNKTVWLQEERAARMTEIIEETNALAKAASYKTTSKEAREIAQETIAKRKKKFIKQIENENYSANTAAYLARMPDIVDGMKAVLKNKTALNTAVKAELDAFMLKFSKLSKKQKARFYEENAELFEDMSDYYNWLKKHSGRIEEGATSSNRYVDMTLDSYVKKNVNSLRKINKKLDEYV